MDGGLVGDRRVKIVAERGAERQLVAGHDPHVIDDRRQSVVATGLEQLDEGFDFRHELTGPQARALPGLAPAFRLGCEVQRLLLGGERLRPRSPSPRGQALARLRRADELFGIRRPCGDVARLRLERRELAPQLLDLLRRSACAVSRLWRRARASKARRVTSPSLASAALSAVSAGGQPVMRAHLGRGGRGIARVQRSSLASRDATGCRAPRRPVRSRAPGRA